MATLRIIPVIDVKAGQVVHAVRGRRESYRPLVSQLTPSTDPLEVASAFRRELGFDEVYIADLDAIAGEQPLFPLFTALNLQGFRQMVDAGVWEPFRPGRLRQAGVDKVIIGLETLSEPAFLAEVLHKLSPERVVFSLDLKDGEPVTEWSDWQGQDARGIADQVIGRGIREMIVLDLARVGSGEGPGTENLCRQLHEAHPHLEIIAGGGVRGPEDLQRLEDAGVTAALVASALHDGRIRPA